MDWAEQEERAELEALAAQKGVKPEELLNPMDDPSNREWVEKQLAAEKEFFGEDYGKDIDEDFSG